MLLQAFLRDPNNQDPLILLKETLAVSHNRHKDFPNLVLFKYNMIDSPMANPLVQECRGVILDEDNNWEVVSRPFDKFFNHGEGHAKPINWSTARVQEKLDGSLMQLYYYKGQWLVASSGKPDAAGIVNGFPFTFADLFWKLCLEKNYVLPDPNEHQHKTFIFEMMSFHNQIIVKHTESRLVLIGVRNRDGQEEPVEDYYNLDWAVVRSFPLTSVAEIEATYEHISPLSQEGYVVVDHNFNRVKMKSPAYVALHHMRDSLSPRMILEVVRSAEVSEVLVAFPEWSEVINKTKDLYDVLVANLEAHYEKIKHIDSQKEFALEAKKSACSGALFSLRAKKVESIKQYLVAMQIDSLAKTLKIDTESL